MAVIEKRKTKEGQISYRVKIRLKGYPIQHGTFKNITKAKHWAAQIETSIREGRHFKNQNSKKVTMGDVIDKYTIEILPRKPKSFKKQKSQLLWWKAQIGSFLLSDISTAIISEQRNKLLEGITSRKNKRSSATVIRYLAALSHVFTIAIKEWNLLEISPIKNLSRLKEPKGRIRFLNEEERKRLLEQCKKSKNPYLFSIVVLAISTGMRQGEILNLSWKDVDFNNNRIILHETKNGERRIVPLTGLAFKLLLELFKKRNLNSYFLFPSSDLIKPIYIRTFWEKTIKDAKIENFRFHDLRHTAASYLAMGKASLSEIAEILGHKTLAMVKRYSHFSEKHTINVVAKMNDIIFEEEKLKDVNCM
ncbi:MAG: site-specific integrase [Parachlamydiales bacterium]|nr:site-specific integrase [Parachlamydiales bacterium]